MSASLDEETSKTDINYGLAEEKPILKMDPECVRKRSNWSTMKNEFKMDDPEFEPAFF